MNNPNEKVEAIFEAALAFKTEVERAEYLARACPDPALRREVESLLAAYKHPDSVFEEETITLALPLSEHAGTRIGRYKLLQQIGEGGMGVVYMAEQEEPVRRRVALKIIKLGMDTRQVVARFEAERQALALMDHPNIAKVLDGGATETGRPYFVMELVQGVPITEYCDKAKLSAQGRLKLFVQVCQAVQHAHQKGIIHRDIKPSNVMVTLHDGVPVPMVIDFGIAKATNQKLTEKTLFTDFGAMIGTPAYMSPEQAEMSGLDIDTRTDIYALGVLLYAMLTGTTPFTEKRLRSLGYGEMQRVILEEEPERPSTRLSTMAAEQKTIVARNCGEDLASLNSLLQGDLDWIVMKCLEKDRQRRYETANGLAHDIQRHLSNEPVDARPPSTAYRLQKMIRRNRTAALTTAVVAVTLVLALGFSTVAFLGERKARLQAAAAERSREQARKATEVETIRADSVATFITGFFDGAIPDLEQRGHLDAIRHLLGVANRLAASLTNAPHAEAEIRLNIGNAYSETLGDFPAGANQFQKAEELGRLLGERGRHLTLLAAENRAASRMWQHQDTNAVLALQQISKEALLRTPPDTDVASRALAGVALFHSYFGVAAEAERAAHEALKYSLIDAGHLESRMRSWEVLSRMAGKRGATAESEHAAIQLLATLQLPHEDPVQKQLFFQTFLRTLWNGNPSILPEEALKHTLSGLSAEDFSQRSHFQGLLGVKIARNGDQKQGLDLLVHSAIDPLWHLGLWSDATILAALTANRELYRNLCVSGLARFASGTDQETSRVLAEPLLILPPEPSFLPTIRELVDRALLGPQPWTRVWGKFLLALLEYREGHFKEAASALEENARESANLFRTDSNTHSPNYCFLRSAIETHLGHSRTARDFYREGVQMLPKLGHTDGTTYVDDDWRAELLRREAALLLGEATPPDSSAPNKP